MHEHAGHRARIMQKLDSGVLQEHELLEILLFNALPRRNTNDLAHRLLNAFGSIPNLLAAPLDEIAKVEGVGPSIAAYLYIIGQYCYKYFHVDADAQEFPMEFDADEFVSYVKMKYRNTHREVLDVYYLGEDGQLFEKKRFSQESFYDVKVEPKEFTASLMKYNPKGVILVHTHPFGVAKPSETDDLMTSKCQMLCSIHNIILCEHVIYAPNGVFSYYHSGKMKEISSNYSVQGVFEPSKEEETR